MSASKSEAAAVGVRKKGERKIVSREPHPFRAVALVSLVLFVFCSPAVAHDFSASYSKINVEESRVHVQFTVNLLGVHDPRDIFAAVTANYHIEAPELPVGTVLESYDFITDTVLRLNLLYTFNHNVARFQISSSLDRITQSDHSHIVQIGDGEDEREAVLDAQNPDVEIDLGGRTFLATALDFAKLGVEHIFTGYDHLAFLMGLLIVTRTLRSLLKVITSFTIAHSVTLALATFRLVALPPRLIESLIALSIAYIGIENFTGRSPVQRWKVTFLFGLVHGFGFSNVLREMTLTRKALAVSLFSFNGGVEVGQLIFVGLMFPLVYWAGTSRFKTQFLFATSLAIMGLGLFWFVQRALG